MRQLTPIIRLHATTHTRYPVACDNYSRTMTSIPCYTAHLLLFLYPNDARRDIGLRCAIRDSYVGWTYAYFYSYARMVSVVTSVRGAQFVKVTLACLMTVLLELITAFELVLKTIRLSFPGFNSWYAIGGIHD